jgi:hypothetical protein
MVLAIPFRGETTSCSSISSALVTIAIDSVIGACAGIGCGLASTAVVFAITGIEEVASETCGAEATGVEAAGAAGEADTSEGF